MYCLTLYVSFEGNYDISLFCYYFWRPFCFMLIISNCPRLIASQPKYFANWVYWQTKSTEKKNLRPQSKVIGKFNFWLPNYTCRSRSKPNFCSNSNCGKRSAYKKKDICKLSKQTLFVSRSGSRSKS